MPAEETKQVLLGCKSLGCSAASGRSGRNDLGGEQTWGPEDKRMAAVPEKGIRQEIVLTGKCGKADLDSVRGKADDVEEETGKCTPRTAVIGAQAPKEGFTEITSGRSRRQQGLVTTCRDSSNEA